MTDYELFFLPGIWKSKSWMTLILVAGNVISTAHVTGQVTPSASSKSTTPVPRMDVKGDWWNLRHESKVDEVSRAESMDLLMIGDSITHAWEAEGKDVWPRFFSSYDSINLGFSGDCTEHVLWRLQHGEIDGHFSALAVLLIGTNNSGRSDSPDQTVEGVRVILQELQRRLPDTKVLLMAVLPRGETRDDPVRKLNRKVNQKLLSLVDHQSIFFLDLTATFLGPTDRLREDLFLDSVHLNSEGYEVWARAMVPVVAGLLHKKWMPPLIQ